MNVIETKIKDLLILEPKVFKDTRGYFFESYNKIKFKDALIEFNFVQDNQSSSSYGVIRGLHYQLKPHAQTKLVRVLHGKIYDVAVDIRKYSPSFGKWFGLELSEENQRQLLVPKGFAHGFSVLSDHAVILYKCDDYYTPQAERGIIFNDETLNIDWKLNEQDILVSDKDKILPEFDNADINFK